MLETDFRRIVREARNRFYTPSLAAGVWLRGETWHHVIGRRGLADGRTGGQADGRADAETVYPIASASKAFIATCLMMLVDEGLVELDAPVKRYLPDLALFTPDLTERLTVRDALCHRSGLPRHDAQLVTRDTATLEQMIGYLRWLEPAWGLRERFGYQNHMFALASLLVQRVSGQPWDDVVRERVFGPLGLTRAHTAWREYERCDDNYAQALITSGRRAQPIDWTSTDPTACAGSLSMSVRDLLRWGRANLALDLVSGAAAKELHRPQMPIRPGELAPYETPFVDSMAYGLGWFVETYRGTPLIWHGGTVNGFKAVVGFLPEPGCAVAALANQHLSQATAVVLRAVADAVLGAEPYDWLGFYQRIGAEFKAKTRRDWRRAVARRGQAPARALPQSCEGTYEHPAYGRLRISNDPDGPWLSQGTRRYQLLPGAAAPWVIATGPASEPVPCGFDFGAADAADAAEPTFLAWLEPELKAPIRFGRVAPTA